MNRQLFYLYKQAVGGAMYIPDGDPYSELKKYNLPTSHLDGDLDYWLDAYINAENLLNDPNTPEVEKRQLQRYINDVAGSVARDRIRHAGTDTTSLRGMGDPIEKEFKAKLEARRKTTPTSAAAGTSTPMGMGTSTPMGMGAASTPMSEEEKARKLEEIERKKKDIRLSGPMNPDKHRQIRALIDEADKIKGTYDDAEDTDTDSGLGGSADDEYEKLFDGTEPEPDSDPTAASTPPSSTVGLGTRRGMPSAPAMGGTPAATPDPTTGGGAPPSTPTSPAMGGTPAATPDPTTGGGLPFGLRFGAPGGTDPMSMGSTFPSMTIRDPNSLTPDPNISMSGSLTTPPKDTSMAYSGGLSSKGMVTLDPDTMKSVGIPSGDNNGIPAGSTSVKPYGAGGYFYTNLPGVGVGVAKQFNTGSGKTLNAVRLPNGAIQAMDPYTGKVVPMRNTRTWSAITKDLNSVYDDPANGVDDVVNNGGMSLLDDTHSGDFSAGAVEERKRQAAISGIGGSTGPAAPMPIYDDTPVGPIADTPAAPTTPQAPAEPPKPAGPTEAQQAWDQKYNDALEMSVQRRLHYIQQGPPNSFANKMLKQNPELAMRRIRDMVEKDFKPNYLRMHGNRPGEDGTVAPTEFDSANHFAPGTSMSYGKYHVAPELLAQGIVPEPPAAFKNKITSYDDGVDPSMFSKVNTPYTYKGVQFAAKGYKQPAPQAPKAPSAPPEPTVVPGKDGGLPTLAPPGTGAPAPTTTSTSTSTSASAPRAAAPSGRSPSPASLEGMASATGDTAMSQELADINKNIQAIQDQMSNGLRPEDTASYNKQLQDLYWRRNQIRSQVSSLNKESSFVFPGCHKYIGTLDSIRN